ncbi:hypothetical protein [Hyphomicrobium sp. CS1BSMeth3]|uniref:hypothetical protein n=1 Tax=Hyphomicrobium sp. CS1BSMeth3 TaxID=1892844 RepID=UPI0009313DD1|nr:hypothetical protein [Hyphomicrobium sp. CS1BSMeth3]
MIKPEVGLVVWYAYLWAQDRDDGHDDAGKFRPAVIVGLRGEGKARRALLLPITHTLQYDNMGVEIARQELLRLGLETHKPSFIVTREGNRAAWPLKEMQPRAYYKPDSAVFGVIHRKFVDEAVKELKANHAEKRVVVIDREKLRKDVEKDALEWRRRQRGRSL